MNKQRLDYLVSSGGIPRYPGPGEKVSRVGDGYAITHLDGTALPAKAPAPETKAPAPETKAPAQAPAAPGGSQE